MRQRGKRRSGIPGGNLFPFVSIMFCTIGGLVLLWAAGSLDAVIEDPDLPKEIARLEESLQRLQEEMHKELEIKEALLNRQRITQSRLEDLQEREDAILAQIREERQRLDALQRQLQERLEATRELADLQQQVIARELLVEEFAQRQVLLEELRQMAEAYAALQEQLQEAEAQKQALQDAIHQHMLAQAHERNQIQELRDMESSEAILLIDEAEGFTPILIDVREDGYVFIADDKSGDVALLSRDELIADTLEPAKTAVSRGVQYPILTVRPGAHASYAGLAQWLRRERIPYSATPLRHDWTVHLGQVEVDP